MFIHFPYSKQLKLGVCDGFSGHLCFQTHPTSATAMDSTSSQVLMPHRSDGLVGYHSYSLFRAYGDWALGPSTSSLNVASIQSTPIWFYMVLSCFIMFHLFFSFGGQIRCWLVQFRCLAIKSGQISLLGGEVMKFAETETLILRIHVLFVSTLPVALEKTCDSLGDEGKRNVNALDLLKVAPTFWRPQSVHHRNIWGETLKWGHPQSSSIDRWF